MIAETLAGIALVKSAVDGIKGAINTANDISDIAGHIDNLFAGEKQVQQERAKKAGVGITDQFGVDNVARDVIDAKIAAEKLQEVAAMVDMRFGHGTWKGILAERQKRIQEAREAAMVPEKLQVTEFITLSDFASLLDVNATELITALMSYDIIASINQRLDQETINIIAEEFETEIEFITNQLSKGFAGSFDVLLAKADLIKYSRASPTLLIVFPPEYKSFKLYDCNFNIFIIDFSILDKC